MKKGEIYKSKHLYFGYDFILYITKITENEVFFVTNEEYSFVKEEWDYKSSFLDYYTFYTDIFK